MICKRRSLPLRASLSIHRADWRPTEQIPERAIGSLIADEFSSIDPNLAAYTNRNILSLRLDSDRWRVSAHAQTYDWKLRSNFTFFLDDPVDGDEVQQVDHRRILGGRVERHFKPASDWRLWLGVEGRFDDIPTVGLYKSVGGVTVAPRGVFAVKERSAAAYAEAAWAPTDTVELFGGLRADIDVLLCPPHATPALPHTKSAQFAIAGSYAMLYNLLQFPAGVVPVTTVSSGEFTRVTDSPNARGDRFDRLAHEVDAHSVGLPVGVQLAGRPFHDEEVLAVMLALEDAIRDRPDRPKVPRFPGRDPAPGPA